MTKKAETWMPLLVAKYLADTMHLSTEQHGGYLLLLMHAWMNEGALPVEDDKLRRITRMSPKAWAEHRDDIRAFFSETDGALRQKRVDLELARAATNIEQRSAAGKASAERRAAQRNAQQNGNEHGNEKATAVERAWQREGQRNGIPIPTPSSPLRSEEKARKRAAPPEPIAPDILVEAGFEPALAAEFIAHKDRLKAPLTPRAWADHQREAAKAGWSASAAAEKVIAKAWKGFEAKYVAGEARPVIAVAKSFRERDSQDAANTFRQMAGSQYASLVGGQPAEDFIDMEAPHAPRIGNG